MSHTSHLFFADDSLLFFTAARDSCTQVSHIISWFCAISGQQLNLQKSYFKVSPNAHEEMMLLRKFCKCNWFHFRFPSWSSDWLGREEISELPISYWGGGCERISMDLLLFITTLEADPHQLCTYYNASHALSCMEVPLSISLKLDSIDQILLGMEK